MNDAILWSREYWKNGLKFGERGISQIQHKLGNKYELYLNFNFDILS